MGSQKADNFIEYTCENSIAHIVLNRPEKLNAFSDDMVRELSETLRRFDGDPDALVAVVSGAGRAFSSGADVRQRQSRTEEEFNRLGGPEGWGAKAADLFTRAANWKPVISAVHGYAIGMGMGIALSADLVVAAEDAKFQITETPRGLSGVRYIELMRFRGGSSFGFQMSMTGRFFSAQEALEHSIVDRVVPNGQQVSAAMELAREIAKHPPLSVRCNVRSRRLQLAQLEARAQLETDALKLHLTQDFAESARAFLEKRPPARFVGR